MHGLNSRMKCTKKKTNELEDKTVEITQSEQQKENKMRKKMNKILGT